MKTPQFPILATALGLLASNFRASAQVFTSYEIQTTIDGRDQLIIHGTTLQWHHLDFGVPGPTVINTSILETAFNGSLLPIGGGQTLTWNPVWPQDPATLYGVDSYSFSFGPLHPSLSFNPERVTVTPLNGRGAVTLIQPPNSGDGGTLILEFNDDLQPGAGFYRVDVTITTVPESAAYPIAGGIVLAGFAFWRRATAGPAI